MMIGPVSAVLLNWKRWYHLEEICTHLRTFDQIKDIHIVCNGHIPARETERLSRWFDDVFLHHPGINLCTLGRFYGAALANHKTVFTADDDLLVLNVPALLDAYDGTKIISNLADDASSKHYQFWQRDPKPYVELGFGSIFPRAWAIEFMQMEWTDDQELKNRKSDKAFSVLFPWTYMRAGPEDITRLTHKGLESGRDENALYKRTDHNSLTDRSVKAAQRYKASLSFPTE